MNFIHIIVELSVASMTNGFIKTILCWNGDTWVAGMKQRSFTRERQKNNDLMSTLVHFTKLTVTLSKQASNIIVEAVKPSRF